MQQIGHESISEMAGELAKLAERVAVLEVAIGNSGIISKRPIPEEDTPLEEDMAELS